ncbi:helix-turn-helix transcriptional regulator [Morganella morganii]|uniref:helix-turn-helix transcriptional regulator n=1 Tax=Morganella morganii TaxID=582 RepID=UPI001A286ACE|nr:AlpA family transcriptional regulator [Morganella morganii]HEG4391480.1 AlpA family transcriptional regulator [Morganella morganii]
MSLLPDGLAHSEKNRLLRLPDVIAITGVPRSTIYLKIKNKEFPSQVQIGSRSVAWLESEIYDWINNNLRNRK